MNIAEGGSRRAERSEGTTIDDRNDGTSQRTTKEGGQNRKYFDVSGDFNQNILDQAKFKPKYFGSCRVQCKIFTILGPFDIVFMRSHVNSTSALICTSSSPLLKLTF
jgi:hypothetical protein